MACIISIGDEHLHINNRSFDNAITFAIETARESQISDDETAMLERFVTAVDNGEYWPGQGIAIAEDFADIDEQKFWARIYLDAARAILDAEIGSQANDSWKARMIYVSYAIGRLFATAARLKAGAVWWPDTRDGREEREFFASLRSD